MIQHLEKGDKHVLAFRVEGDITESEVKQVLKKIKSRIETLDHFNLYVEVKEIEGMELAALKERFSFIFSHYKSLMDKIEKVSLVSEKNWIQKLAQGLLPHSKHRSAIIFFC